MKEDTGKKIWLRNGPQLSDELTIEGTNSRALSCAPFDEMTFPAAVLALLVAAFTRFGAGPDEAASLSLFVSAALVINNVICALDRA